MSQESKKLQLELIQKVSQPNYLDEKQTRLANHVRNCTFCLDLLLKASEKCEKHYGKKEN